MISEGGRRRVAASSLWQEASGFIGNMVLIWGKHTILHATPYKDSKTSFLSFHLFFHNYNVEMLLLFTFKMEFMQWEGSAPVVRNQPLTGFMFLLYLLSFCSLWLCKVDYLLACDSSFLLMWITASCRLSAVALTLWYITTREGHRISALCSVGQSAARWWFCIDFL